MTVVTGGHCSCPGFLRGRFPGPGVRLPDEEGLALVREARKGAGLPGLCQRHLRPLAAGGLGLLNNKTQEVLCWRLKQVYLHRTRLPQLRQKKPKWFRAGSRAVTTQDLLGTFRFPPVQWPAFDFDPASVRRRRTILPWYMLVDGEHKELEAKGCLGWSEVRQCHLDLEVPQLDPSGYPHKMGAPTGRFSGAVVLGSTSALGDALVGRRKWTDPQVRRERDVVLGRDGVAALAYVEQVRGWLVEQYRAAFEWMKQTELEGFGEVSYFTRRAA
jgi:hypothetical protein